MTVYFFDADTREPLGVAVMEALPQKGETIQLHGHTLTGLMPRDKHRVSDIQWRVRLGAVLDSTQVNIYLTALD